MVYSRSADCCGGVQVGGRQTKVRQAKEYRSTRLEGYAAHSAAAKEARLGMIYNDHSLTIMVVSRATDTANTGCAKCGYDEARRGCGFLLAAPSSAAARKRDADSYSWKSYTMSIPSVAVRVFVSIRQQSTVIVMC